MLKLCVVSDNHGDRASIEKILMDNPACDYYFHLGDSLFDEKEIKPFLTVKGNCDYHDFDKQAIIQIENHRILLIHGDGYTWSMNTFAYKAKQDNVDVVFFGHTHIFYDNIISGIRFINPGSTYHNRDLTPPCYARVFILDDGSIKVERVDL